MSLEPTIYKPRMIFGQWYIILTGDDHEPIRKDGPYSWDGVCRVGARHAEAGLRKDQ
jgi:hypothetical protein